MESKRILFNLASRMRPERCKATIMSIIDNVASPDFSIWLKIDKNDPKVMAYNDVYDYCIAAVEYSDNKIHAINRDMPQTGWDILVNVSDDQKFTVKGFDNIIREHCGPDDFCLFPEPFADSQAKKLGKQRLAVMSIMGYDYYMRDGYVYHPSYKRTHCDEEAAEVATMRGRLKEVDIPIFIHEHPAAGFKQYKDDQYLLERITWKDDLSNLNKRRLEGFPK